MNASSLLQRIIAAYLASPDKLRVVVPIVQRRHKEIGAEIEAAVSSKGLCLHVMPPLPTQAMQNVPFVFYQRAEVRVRIIEIPAMNGTGADAYDLVDDIAVALHWHEFPELLAHPLQLATRPSEMVEDPRTRIIDVIFEATYGFAQATGSGVSVLDDFGISVTDDFGVVPTDGGEGTAEEANATLATDDFDVAVPDDAGTLPTDD